MVEAKVKQVDSTKYLSLQGKIDMANAKEYEELLENNMQDVKKLVVDLAELSFIDSTGVGSLVAAIRTASSKGVRFELVNVPEGINEIFEVIGVYEVLNSWQRE